jgi:hypothetical protein
MTILAIMVIIRLIAGHSLMCAVRWAWVRVCELVVNIFAYGWW